MDSSVIDELDGLGFDTSLRRLSLRVGVLLDESDRVVRIGDEVPVTDGERVAGIVLPPVRELFTGNRRPPRFDDGPTIEYAIFFALIEGAAINYCVARVQAVSDREVLRLYRQLRRSPDGGDGNPLFGYLRAAARLYMALRDVSRAEFHGVVGRLAECARTLSTDRRSTNYVDLLAAQLA